jgi:hypothetical protein
MELDAPMADQRLPKSIRKYLREAKARIRRQVADSQEAERAVRSLAAEVRARFSNRET